MPSGFLVLLLTLCHGFFMQQKAFFCLFYFFSCYSKLFGSLQKKICFEQSLMNFILDVY